MDNARVIATEGMPTPQRREARREEILNSSVDSASERISLNDEISFHRKKGNLGLEVQLACKAS